MSEKLRVRKPGLLTTIQDLGRPNAIMAGVPPGGAMDRFAHRAANLLAGNDEGAATLECTLNGPELIAMESCLVAITGADFDPRVNGDPVPMWEGMFLHEGDEVTFAGRRSGARSYIAVGGGIAGDRWLGSMSTYMLAARGGMHGRHLMSGDVIATAGPPSGDRQFRAASSLATSFLTTATTNCRRSPVRTSGASAPPAARSSSAPHSRSAKTPIGWATGSKALESTPQATSCSRSA